MGCRLLLGKFRIVLLLVFEEGGAVEKEVAVLYKWASALALITIFYNIAEGGVSVGFGLGDETVSLFGFGLDSFVEVISGIGIWHMVRRQRKNPAAGPDIFERQALRITGFAFYLLTFGLAGTAIVNIFTHHHPETTFWGIIIAAVSIVTMWILIHYKVKIGKALRSPAILADANCTKTCVYLSFALLFASIGYELTGIGWFDSIGAVVIAGFSWKEGRESFLKAKGIGCKCQTNCP
ncbi:MAG: cation transporter [Candidatus Kuenenia sp.]|nr:cation transporter [Candidatus Kuenenia sp.]